MFAATELLPARYQMALSLGFHIVQSCFGVAFPALIYLVHRRGLRHNDEDALTLARRWSKVAAVLFAVGAVSGTILSFEMGLLWPGMMSKFGDVIGLPFALEGIAFFIEAIFIGIYLYGWDRLPPRVHLNTLIPIMLSGLFGTAMVLAVNAWMNAPSGFRIVDGEVVDVDPAAAIFNNAFWGQFVHMFVATYFVVGFCVAAVYAVGMLRGRRDHLHRLGFTTAFAVATIAALIQPFVGHVAGMRLAEQQPSKLAAMDMAVETEQNAPLRLGGVLIDGKVYGAIDIPGLGSLIARAGFDRPVQGLDTFPEHERPPANIVHWSFQTMVGIGTLLAAFCVWFWWRRRRGRDPLASNRVLTAIVVAAPLSIVAMEAGWVTTEVGRQPWIVYRVMKVEDAVTTNSGIWISLIVVVVVYTAMAYAAGKVMLSMGRRWRETGGSSLSTPYGPTEIDAAIAAEEAERP
jgi:cytochrome d ubiquinol oxidase subunit I